LVICIPCSSCTADIPEKEGEQEVGIRSINIDDFSIAPNPFSNFLNINIPATRVSNAQIKIYNLAGKEIQSHNYSLTLGNNQVQLNTEKMTVGTYILVLETDEFKKVQKLIK